MGDSRGSALEGLRNIYYHPEDFDVLPYRHNYTLNNELALTGYFLPSYSVILKPGFLDNRGYTNEEKAKEYWQEKRNKLATNPKALVDHCAERCFNAEEAFALEGENKFNKINIAELLTKIRALKLCPPIEMGRLDYTYKNNKHSAENITGFSWVPNNSSNLKILEHPIWTLSPKTDENGKVIWEPPKEKIHNLYVIGVDGIDIGKAQTSDLTKSPSDFCAVVYKRAYGMSEPEFVAIYKDRPNDPREAFKITLCLAKYYNALINIEATRMHFFSWAKELKEHRLFMKRPRATLSDLSKNRNTQYGTPATVAVINHQTDLIADYVNDYCHLIWFDEMLDELNRYTDENKSKFDIVAAMGMCMLADEELNGIVPKQVLKIIPDEDSIGYYTDENGIRRWGVIPKELNNQILWNNDFGQNEDRGIRTTDPRIYYGYI